MKNSIQVKIKEFKSEETKSGRLKWIFYEVEKTAKLVEIDGVPCYIVPDDETSNVWREDGTKITAMYTFGYTGKKYREYPLCVYTNNLSINMPSGLDGPMGVGSRVFLRKINF